MRRIVTSIFHFWPFFFSFLSFYLYKQFQIMFFVLGLRLLYSLPFIMMIHVGTSGCCALSSPAVLFQCYILNVYNSCLVMNIEKV